MQADIDALAVTGLESLLVQAVKVSLEGLNYLVILILDFGDGQYKALALHHLFDKLWRIAVLLLVAVVMVLPDIRDVLQEQHGEDEILVGIGADGATEDIAGAPNGVVDNVLIDLFGHKGGFLGVITGMRASRGISIGLFK